MLAKPSVKTGFQPKSINLTGSKPSSNRQRTALSNVRASSSNNPEKNTKGSEESATNVTLKVVPALLNEQRGVGVIATVGVIAAAKLAQASIDGVSAAVEKDLKPAIENPENLENWKKTLSSAVEDAKSNARKSMEQVGANFNEALAELKASTDAANEKIAKEVELGAINWEKTTAAIKSTPNSTSSTGADKDMVAVLTEVEDKGTEILKNVGKEIKDMTNRKDSLQTGWLSRVLGRDNNTTKNTTNTTSPPPATVTATFTDNNNNENKTTVVSPTTAPPSTTTPPSSSTTTAAVKETFPTTPEVSQPSAAATTVATEVKTGLDSSLDAVTKGGRHVSMLSAPTGAKSTPPQQENTANPATVSDALGFSKSSSSSSAAGNSSPGASSGGSSSSGSGAGAGASAKSGLDALKAAAGAGAVASAASVVAVGGGGGGSDGGNSGGGGGGSGGDGSSSGGSSSDNDGNKNNLYLLLLALAMAGVGYYLSQQQAKKQPAK